MVFYCECSKMFSAFLSFQQQICKHSSGKLRWWSIITRALVRHAFKFENKIEVDVNHMFLWRIQLPPREQEYRHGNLIDVFLILLSNMKKVIEGRVLLITAIIRLFSISTSKNKKRMRKSLRGTKREQKLRLNWVINDQL